MLKPNLKNILRLAYLCFLLLILGFITLISSASSPTLAQSNWTTYEDDDPLVLPGYSEDDWQTVSVPEAVGGNLTWTEVPSAELVLYFEGSAIEILYSRGPEGGDFHISLDDMTWPQFNSYAEQYLYGTSIQQFNLAPGVHQLVITNDDGAFWLEAIRIQGVLIQVVLDSLQNPSPQQPVFVQQVTTFTQDFEDSIYGPEEARPVVTGYPHVTTDFYRNINPWLGYYLPENRTRVAAAYSSNTAGTNIKLQVDLTMGAAPNDIYTIYGLSFYSQSSILYYPTTPPIHISTRQVSLLDANNVILYQCYAFCPPWLPTPVSNVKTVRLEFIAFATHQYLIYLVAFDNIVIWAEDPCAGKPNVNPATVIALREYGVQAICEGGIDWKENELETILAGVTNTATALHQFNQSGDYVSTAADDKSLFKHVMGNLKVRRLANDTDVQLGGCTGSQDTACTYNEGNTLAFYGNVASRPTGFSEQLVVHELGHRFDYRSQIVTGKSLENYVQGQPPPRTEIRDCQYDQQGQAIRGDIVMGPIGQGLWTRGDRGWGTSGTSVTLFQQNVTNDFIEAAADMFLNWVYRYLVDKASVVSNSNPCLGAITVPLGTGFQNINGSSMQDSTLPGNKRFWWMNDTMTTILSHIGWN